MAPRYGGSHDVFPSPLRSLAGFCSVQGRRMGWPVSSHEQPKRTLAIQTYVGGVQGCPGTRTSLRMALQQYTPYAIRHGISPLTVCATPAETGSKTDKPIIGYGCLLTLPSNFEEPWHRGRTSFLSPHPHTRPTAQAR